MTAADYSEVNFLALKVSVKIFYETTLKLSVKILYVQSFSNVSRLSHHSFFFFPFLLLAFSDRTAAVASSDYVSAQLRIVSDCLRRRSIE